MGNAARMLDSCAIGSVHPHARGECGPGRVIRQPTSGSPPRPWGMRILLARTRGASRFTPTPVGNAAMRSCRSRRAAVHPHARGECLPSTARSAPSAGSPPRPWGMPFSKAELEAMGRFTPTPVGNAALTGDDPAMLAVHPHARGECPVIRGEQPAARGSPPRPWGMRH